MTYVHLPAAHSDADLALAGAVAELLESGELYVTWSEEAGAARPVIPAAVRRVCPPVHRRRALVSLLDALLRGRPRPA